MADQGRTIPRKLNPFGFYSPLLVSGSVIQKRIPEDEQKIIQYIDGVTIKREMAQKKSPIYIYSYFYQTTPPLKNLIASKVADRLWLGDGLGLAFLVALGLRIIFAAGRPGGGAALGSIFRTQKRTQNVVHFMCPYVSLVSEKPCNTVFVG